MSVMRASGWLERRYVPASPAASGQEESQAAEVAPLRGVKYNYCEYNICVL